MAFDQDFTTENVNGEFECVFLSLSVNLISLLWIWVITLNHIKLLSSLFPLILPAAYMGVRISPRPMCLHRGSICLHVLKIQISRVHLNETDCGY